MVEEDPRAGTDGSFPQQGVLRKLAPATLQRLHKARTEAVEDTDESPGPYEVSTLIEVARRGVEDAGKRPRTEHGEDSLEDSPTAADGVRTRTRSGAGAESSQQTPATAAAAATVASQPSARSAARGGARGDAVASAMRDGFAMLVRAVGTDREAEAWDDVEEAVEWSQQRRREEEDAARRELFTAIIRALVVEGTELTGQVRAIATAVKRWRAGKRTEEDVREVMGNYGCLPPSP